MPQECPSNRKLACADCRLYTRYFDHNQVTKRTEEKFICGHLLPNPLLTQLSVRVNELSAAIESFRNEMVRLSNPDHQIPGERPDQGFIESKVGNG